VPEQERARSRRRSTSIGTGWSLPSRWPVQNPWSLARRVDGGRCSSVVRIGIPSRSRPWCSSS